MSGKVEPATVTAIGLVLFQLKLILGILCRQRISATRILNKVYTYLSSLANHNATGQFLQQLSLETEP